MTEPDAKNFTTIGIVDGGGAGGTHSQGDEHWNFLLPLVAWRTPGGDISRKELWAVLPRLNERQINDLMQSSEPFDVVKIRVDLTPQTFVADTRYECELLELIGTTAEDEQINALVKELKTPDSMTHPTLGTLTQDVRSGSYECNINVGGQTVMLSIRPDDAPIETLLSKADDLYQRLDDIHKTCRDYIANHIFEELDGEWINNEEEWDFQQEDEDDPKPFVPLSADEFANAMKLRAIYIYDTSVDLSYEGEDMLGEHALSIELDDHGKPESYDMHG